MILCVGRSMYGLAGGSTAMECRHAWSGKLQDETVAGMRFRWVAGLLLHRTMLLEVAAKTTAVGSVLPVQQQIAGSG